MHISTYPHILHPILLSSYPPLLLLILQSHTHTPSHQLLSPTGESLEIGAKRRERDETPRFLAEVQCGNQRGVHDVSFHSPSVDVFNVPTPTFGRRR